MRPLVQLLDIYGNPVVGGIIPSDTVNAMYFTAAGVKNQNIPAGANWVLVTPGSGMDIFASLGGTAAAPTADVTGGTATAQDSTLRKIPTGVTTISVATAAASGIVTLEYWS